MRWSLLVVLGACGFTAPPSSGASPDAPVTGDAAADASRPVPFDATLCPRSYVAVDGQPYRYHWGVVIGGLVTWTTAAQLCAAEQTSGGYQTHLAVFETVAERDAVWNAAGPTISWNWTWTGAFKVSATEWTSVTGQPIVPSWAAGEPLARSSGTPKHALGIGADAAPMGDRDIPTDWALNAICECDGRDVVAMP